MWLWVEENSHHVSFHLKCHNIVVSRVENSRFCSEAHFSRFVPYTSLSLIICRVRSQSDSNNERKSHTKKYELPTTQFEQLFETRNSYILKSSTISLAEEHKRKIFFNLKCKSGRKSPRGLLSCCSASDDAHPFRSVSVWRKFRADHEVILWEVLTQRGKIKWTLYSTFGELQLMEQNLIFRILTEEGSNPVIYRKLV